MTANPKPVKHDILRKIIRISGKSVKYIIGSMLILLFLVFGFILIRKDAIGERLLMAMNEQTRGEIILDDISINPFVHFPNFSITLTNTNFFDKKADERDSLDVPIAEVGNIHISFNLIHLIRNKVTITAVSVDDAVLNITQDKNGKYNFEYALAPPKKEVKPPINKTKKEPAPVKENAKKEPPKKKEQPAQQKAPPAKSPEPVAESIDFSLEKLALKNVQINFNDHASKNTSSVLVSKLRSSLAILPDSIECKINTRISIQELYVSDQLSISDKNISLNTIAHINLKKEEVYTPFTRFGYGKAWFNLKGTYLYDETQLIDLKIDGQDNDMSLLNLVLSQEGINQLEKGEVNFEGYARGSINNTIPEINCTFGASGLRIGIPNTQKKIDQLSLAGTFHSGTKPDFSQSNLEIDTILGILPGGYINASFRLQNFIEPHLAYNCQIESDLDGFDHIFEMGLIEDLTGKISISDSYMGSLTKDKGWVDELQDTLSIKLDKISFNLPEILEVERLDAYFSGHPDTLSVHQFNLLAAGSDIAASGTLLNAIDLLINRKRTIQADLHAKSKVYDLPKSLAYDPSIGQSFPYKIKDIDAKVLITTTHKKLLSFHVSPEINFDFHQCKAEIENFLPPVEISKGNFKLGETNKALHLEFTGFEARIAGGDVLAEYHYYQPARHADTMTIHITTRDINPGKLIYLNPEDKIPDILNANIDSELTCRIHMPGTRVFDLSLVEFQASKLKYKGRENTIIFKNLLLNLQGIQYEQDFFSSLTAAAFLDADAVQSKDFNFKNVHYDGIIKQGIYNIKAKKINLIDAPGTSTFIIKPFASPPEYDVTLSAKEIEVGQLFSNFNRDSLLTGKANLNLHVNFKGDNRPSILSSMEGEILLTGDSLLLYGLDVDKFIKNYERSQNFNLIDLGAVAFAGPLGLAVTKGSDYARIVIGTNSETTPISQVSSQWEISAGEILLSDVALATLKNRIVAYGWYHLPTDSLDISISLVDESGCSILSQRISGISEKPELGKVKVFRTLIAPVTNLLEDATFQDCKVVYDGSVPHPEAKK